MLDVFYLNTEYIYENMKNILFFESRESCRNLCSIQHTIPESGIRKPRFRDWHIRFWNWLMHEIIPASKYNASLHELSYAWGGFGGMQSYREDMSINRIISHCGLTLIINCMICCHPKFVKLGIEKQTEKIILTI